MRRRLSGAGAVVVLAVILLAVAGAAEVGPLSRIVEVYRENILFAIDPTASRAYSYGELHFSSRIAADYDIERALYFFGIAARIDPTMENINLQLARAYFLRGNFNTALAYANRQIDLHGDGVPTAYYVRGLIEGYTGRYDAAIRDYEIFLGYHPSDWAAVNDYAWVLLKANRPADAASVTAMTLLDFPDNAWLLNTNAIARFEVGDVPRALSTARSAVEVAKHISNQEWLTAYPGNDPRVAQLGISTLQRAARDNLHRIELAAASSTVQ